jgi:hypothetical protein
LESSNLQNGLGKVFLAYNWVKNDIAIYYSHDSLLLAYALGKERNNSDMLTNSPLFKKLTSRHNLQYMTEELLYQYDYLAPEQIINGKLGDRKVLFMPGVISMGEEEVAAVRTFLKNGGMVIADYNPAMANQHGRWLDKSQLADVFGKFEKMNINRYGKGYGVYLDDYISGVNARAQKNEARGIQQGILRLLKKAGVVPFARVNDSNDIPRDFALFAHKKSVYLCMLAQRSQAGEKRTSAVGAEGGGSKDATIGGSFTRKISLVKPMHV